MLTSPEDAGFQINEFARRIRFIDTNATRASRPRIIASGQFTDGPVQVSMETTTGATIRYTTDGSEPTPQSDLYTAPITLNTQGQFNLKARAYAPDLASSLVAHKMVLIQVDQTPPGVLRAFLANPGTVNVIFSEIVNAADAEVPGNYSLGTGIRIEKARLLDDGQTVLLSCHPLEVGKETSLTVRNIRDRWGNQASTVKACPVEAAGPDPSLLGYWSFDCSDADLTGRAHRVTFHGHVSYETGKSGSAVCLDGRNSYVILPAEFLGAGRVVKL